METSIGDLFPSPHNIMKCPITETKCEPAAAAAE